MLDEGTVVPQNLARGVWALATLERKPVVLLERIEQQAIAAMGGGLFFLSYGVLLASSGGTALLGALVAKILKQRTYRELSGSSRLRLATVATEVGGRFNAEARQLLVIAAAARARGCLFARKFVPNRQIDKALASELPLTWAAEAA